MATIWAEQLASSTGIDIRPVPEGRRAMTPGASMLYPTAQVIQAAIKSVPEGETITPKELRQQLAREYSVEYVCPVTTTMMLRIVAEAANEARGQRKPVIPVWRVLDKRASALRNLSFDPEWILDERARSTRS